MSGWVNAPVAVLTHLAAPAGQRGAVHHAQATTDWRVVTALSVLLVAVTLLAYVRIFRSPRPDWMWRFWAHAPSRPCCG